MRISPFIVICLLYVICLTSCEQYPKDPANTLEKVQNNVLRAGITESPPYVIIKNDEPSGIEVEIIKGFAQELNARIEWVKGSEETIMELLKERELHICAGGFSSKSLWKKHVYLVEPHDTLVYSWGVPSGKLPEEIEDKDVYVKRGTIAGALAAKKDAKPIYVDSLSGNEPLILAPKKDLRKMDYNISEETVKKVMISLAIPKGENAFLEKLNTYINRDEQKNKR